MLFPLGRSERRPTSLILVVRTRPTLCHCGTNTSSETGVAAVRVDDKLTQASQQQVCRQRTSSVDHLSTKQSITYEGCS